MNQSHGLLSALELPNSLDLNKIERCKPSDLFEVELNKIELDFSNYFLTLKAIENHFTKLTKLFHKSNVLYLATPYIVRPAIIEACNINLDTIPMISNDQNNGLCVPGYSFFLKFIFNKTFKNKKKICFIFFFAFRSQFVKYDNLFCSKTSWFYKSMAFNIFFVW